MKIGLIDNDFISRKNHNFPNLALIFISAFDYNSKYDLNFWENDLILIFKRIEILFKYGVLPFVMRYKEYENSPFKKFYIELCQWANQPRNCAKYSYNEYIDTANKKGSKIIRDKYPELKKMFDLKLAKAII